MELVELLFVLAMPTARRKFQADEGHLHCPLFSERYRAGLRTKKDISCEISYISVFEQARTKE
jgi:hypothetical protein